MTKEELFEMFDRYDAYEILDTGETVQVIYWHDLKHIVNEIIKNYTMPNDAGKSEQVSVSAAKQYAEFCVRCDRQGLPLIDLHDFISLYYGTDLAVGAVLPE